MSTSDLARATDWETDLSEPETRDATICTPPAPMPSPEPYPLQNIESLFYKTMPDPFEEKLQRKIDSCGPYCSCLVTAALFILALIYFVQR